MAKDDLILSEIKRLNDKLDEWAKLSDRVLILEQREIQVWREIKTIKTTLNNPWWKEMVKGVAVIVIASVISVWAANKMNGATNEKANKPTPVKPKPKS